MKKIILSLLFIFSLLTSYAQTAEEYYEQGLAKSVLGFHEEAIVVLTEAITKNPSHADAYGTRGVSRFYLKDYRGSILDCSKAIELETEYLSDTYCQRGVSKIYLKDARGAILDFNLALENDPLSPIKIKALFYRGFAKGILEDVQGAILDYSSVIEIDPKHAEAYFRRGIGKIMLQELGSGCLDLSKAGELGHIEAYDMISKACNK